MRMGEVGIGIDAGVKDFRAIFVFHNNDALERFMDVGVAIGGQADVAGAGRRFRRLCERRSYT